jgi:hypothetical protein
MTRRTLLAAALCLVSLQAHAQAISQPPSGFQRLFSQGASSGNGADLTEDTLSSCSTYSLPANTLANVGDTVRIVASGTLGLTTDNKTVKIKIGSLIAVAMATATATSSAWYAEAVITKTGPNTQTYSAVGNILATNGTGFARSAASTLTDTGALGIVTTGQNVTSSVAGSITCLHLIVDLMR